jgi:hypothetical protein
LAEGTITPSRRPSNSGGVVWIDRGMAAANAARMSMEVLGAIGVIDASTGWVPVAGQVVVIATGVYLAGDFLYNNVKPFRDAVDDTGRFIASTATDAYHFGESAMKTVDSTVDSAVSSSLHAAKSFSSGALHTARSVADDVGSFLGL